MKKLLSIFLILCLCSTALFAAEGGDEYDDGYVYKMNGAGDRIFKMELGGVIPLNFNKQLNPGFCASLGFLQFVSDNIALGGNLTLTTNLTVGEKTFISIPITFSVMYQPTIESFEFPLQFDIGFATHTMTSLTYFPAFTLKGSAGAFYRISESWSAGISGCYTWTPEWFKDSSRNFNGMFTNIGINLRFHF